MIPQLAAGTPEDRWAVAHEAVREWQDLRLRRTVAHVTARSRYWAARFAAAGVAPGSVQSTADLYRCPTLTKAQLAAALDESPNDYGGLLCGELEMIMASGVNHFHTSGTLGRPIWMINSDAGGAICDMHCTAMLAEAGARAGDTVMLGVALSTASVGWSLYRAAKQSRMAVLAAGAPADTDERVQTLIDRGPAVVAVTPGEAMFMGRALADRGVSAAELGVRGLLLGGAAFSEPRRQRIEALWDLPGATRNCYVIAEGGPGYAIECEAQDGMHLFERDTIHQFWTPDGDAPAEEGKLAEHVFTSIAQRTMATWFNFRTRDGAIYRDGECSCGRTSRRMWIQERLDDMIKVRGVNVFPSAVEAAIIDLPGAGSEFRLVVGRREQHDDVTVELEREPAIEPAQLTAAVEDRLRDALGTRLAVVVREPGTLPRSGRKTRRWLDLRDPG